MAKSQYIRHKPHLNIGTMGHVDHGKTTLTAAITKLLAEQHPEVNQYVSFEGIDLAPKEIARAITITIAHVAYGFRGEEVPVVPVSALGSLAGEPRWVASFGALLDAVDRYVPVPPRELTQPFLMPIENVLTISGRGTVVTGAVERGTLGVGE